MRYVLFLLQLTWPKRVYLNLLKVRWNDHTMSYISLVYRYLCINIYVII